MPSLLASKARGQVHSIGRTARMCLSAKAFISSSAERISIASFPFETMAESAYRMPPCDMRNSPLCCGLSGGVHLAAVKKPIRCVREFTRNKRKSFCKSQKGQDTNRKAPKPSHSFCVPAWLRLAALLLPNSCTFICLLRRVPN